MTIVYWPRDLLLPRNVSINPAPATVAGVASLSGFRQAVASPAGVWSIVYDAVRVLPSQRLLWRALAAQIEGRANAILLPIHDRDDIRPLAPSAAAPVMHGDGAPHGDGTPYRSARADVVASAAVAQGGVRLTARTISGAPIAPGHHFSIGHRLYRVKALEEVAGAATRFSFWPPAREPIPTGAPLEFAEPVCKVRLAEDGGMDAPLDTGRHAFPSIHFIEDPR